MNMHFGLRQQLLLIALLPMSLIALTLTAYFTVTGLEALDGEQTDRGQAIASYLAPAAEYGVISGDREGLQKLVQAALAQRDAQAVSVVSSDGRVLAISGRTALNPAQLMRSEHRLREGLAASGVGWQAFAAPIHRSVADIEDYLDPRTGAGATPATVGWVFVELSSSELALRKSEFIGTSILILLTGLMLTGALALRLSRRVVGPVEGLVGAVRHMGDGELDTRVVPSTGGELGELERGFNDMAIRLEDMHRTMQERIDSATAQLSHQARHDPLTGLINRRAFEDKAQLAVESAQSHGLKHALCFLDLDQFKIVNDTCGHAAGDDLLRQLSLQLRARIRGQDTLARLGGDEFGVLLESCELDDALRVAESIRQLVEDFRFFWHDKIFTVGVSIGLVTIDHGTHTLHEVLSAADRACYAAKDGGRNRVEVFRTDLLTQQRREGDGAWGNRVARALEDHSLVLYAQTIEALGDGPSPEVSAELLVRMLDDHGDLIQPMAFLPAAERFNLLPAIDTWVLEETARHLVLRHDDAAYSMNVSIATLCENSFAEQVADVLTRYSLSGHRLCFELSEATVSRDFGAAQRFSDAVRAMGCRIALDAFGGGLSSFNALENLAPHYVKVGGSLIHSAVDNSVSLTLLRAIIDVSHGLQIGVIAEALETPEQQALVTRLGVSWGQGFLLGVPQPLPRLTPRSGELPFIELADNVTALPRRSGPLRAYKDQDFHR